jgi:hypothetical protein
VTRENFYAYWCGYLLTSLEYVLLDPEVAEQIARQAITRYEVAKAELVEEETAA